MQRTRQLRQPIVRYLARTQRQTTQTEQSLRYVDERLVPDLVTERHIQRRDPRPALRQIRHPDIANIITRAQIQFPQIGHFR